MTRRATNLCTAAVHGLILIPVIFVVGDLPPAAAQPAMIASPENTLHTKTERGPIKVDVRITPEKPRLSDEPKLTLTVTAKDGVRVEMPPFGESLGGFVIRDFHEPLPKLADGDQVLQQVYTLEPTSAGKVSIDPILIRFFDERPDGDGQEHEVETEGMVFEIDTMISSEAPSLTDLKPADDPVDLPKTLSSSAIAAWAFGLIGAIIAGILLWKFKASKTKREPPLTPQQLAWRELNDLLDSNLSTTDVKEFFVQLTAVVRRYIERSTGVQAPEQTTEEFLREANRQRLFADADNQRLEAFLESADLVKFAGYQPDQESIKQSTHRAKQFIELRASSDTTFSLISEVG